MAIDKQSYFESNFIENLPSKSQYGKKTSGLSIKFQLYLISGSQNYQTKRHKHRLIHKKTILGFREL